MTEWKHSSNIQNLSSNEVNYPLIYEIKGAGSPVVNGTYSFQGICNDRPYYLKYDNTAALWYFYTNLFPSSYWCGWYISKSVNTENTNASEDFYSAYSHGKLPPSSGWVARLPGISPTSGCGANPPPSYVGSSDTKAFNSAQTYQNFSSLEKLVIEGFSCSPWFPRRIIISGGGCISANGIYCLEGELNNRPYFRKDGGSECLWYFSDCPLSRSTSGKISYNGWYLSTHIGTSSYHSTEDMYSSYFPDCVPRLPFESDVRLVRTISESQIERPWIVRSPGLPPLSGCGVLPIPTMRYLIDETVPQFGMLLRICLPNGVTKSLHISENDSIVSVKLMCENILHVPYYQIRLLLRGCSLSRLVGLEVQPKDNDLLKIAETGIEMGDIVVVELIMPTYHSVSSSKICIIGAGPVGLWTAIQLKILRSDWCITCHEKRTKYERSHALAISSMAFEGMVEWCPGRPSAAELVMLKDRWMPRTRTSTVEGDLRSLAINMGIEIIYSSEIMSLAELCCSDNYEVVVCCDGAKSSCRSELVNRMLPNGKEFRHQKQLGNLLQIKFEAHGEITSSKGQLSQFLQNLPAMQEFFSILPGNFDPDKCSTPMTVFALMTSEVDASLDVTELESNSSIHADLLTVLSDVCSAGIVEGTMKTSILPVSYSITQVAAGNINDSYIFLAGDAAMGLPLEKGLNYGWKIASRLCHYLAYSPNYEISSMAYCSFFERESSLAIQVVEQQYSHYVNMIQTASSLRNFLRPFALYLRNNN